MVSYFFFLYSISLLFCSGLFDMRADDAKVAILKFHSMLCINTKNQYSVSSMKACPKYGNIFDGTIIFPTDGRGRERRCRRKTKEMTHRKTKWRRKKMNHFVRFASIWPFIFRRIFGNGFGFFSSLFSIHSFNIYFPQKQKQQQQIKNSNHIFRSDEWKGKWASRLEVRNSKWQNIFPKLLRFFF